MINLEVNLSQVDPRPSPVYLRDALAAAPRPVTVLLTGPCTNLVHALDLAPELAARIARVVWMGGAVDVGGNVRTYKGSHNSRNGKQR